MRTPFIRLVKEGSIVDPSRYTRSGGLGAAIADQVVDDRVLELFADGHTVVLQGLHRLWPPLIDFAGELTAELGHPVQINAYVTPSASQGFAAHYDVHDVFVLQIAGHKRWIVRRPGPRRSASHTAECSHRQAVSHRASERPTLDVVLEPGDTLYLPRGYIHSARGAGRHLRPSDGGHPRAYPARDRRGTGRARRRRRVAQAIAAARCRRVRPGRPRNRGRCHGRRADRPSPVGPSARCRTDPRERCAREHPAGAARSPRSGGSTRAPRRRHDDRDAPASPRIMHRAGQRAHTVLPGRTLRLPPAAREAVDALLDSGLPIRVGDLPAVSESEALGVVT